MTKTAIPDPAALANLARGAADYKAYLLGSDAHVSRMYVYADGVVGLVGRSGAPDETVRGREAAGEAPVLAVAWRADFTRDTLVRAMLRRTLRVAPLFPFPDSPNARYFAVLKGVPLSDGFEEALASANTPERATELAIDTMLAAADAA